MSARPINIIRSNPRVRYTALPNHVANDEKLSARALGVLYYILTKPPAWRVIPDQLRSRFDMSYRLILKLLNELIDAGYIKRELMYVNFRITGVRYLVTDEPGYFGEIPAEVEANSRVTADQHVDFVACCEGSQPAKRHHIERNNRQKDKPLTPTSQREVSPQRLVRKVTANSPSCSDQGTFEREIAALLCPDNLANGFEMLGLLPETEVAQLCTMKRRGTLDESTLLRIRSVSLSP